MTYRWAAGIQHTIRRTMFSACPMAVITALKYKIMIFAYTRTHTYIHSRPTACWENMFVFWLNIFYGLVCCMCSFSLLSLLCYLSHYRIFQTLLNLGTISIRIINVLHRTQCIRRRANLTIYTNAPLQPTNAATNKQCVLSLSPCFKAGHIYLLGSVS